MNIFKNLSVKWKIYFIAIVSIIGFGSYLAFNMMVNTNNAKILTALNDIYFPILEKSNANSVRLDRISDLLNTAVLTGEEEYLDGAKGTAEQMGKEFKLLLTLESNQKNKIEKIISYFNLYFSQAYDISNEMALGEPNFDTLNERVSAKEENLGKLRDELREYIEYSRINFTDDIKKANDNSLNLLKSGLAIWAVNILILSIAVFAIAKVILANIARVSTSLNEIASGGGDFSKQIEVSSNDEIGQLAKSFNHLLDNLKEKTNDLLCMMENMHQGLFTITQDESIHPEYAAYIENIFQTKNIAGRNYSELLYEYSGLGSDTLDQAKVTLNSLLDADVMMWEFNAHALPAEYQIILPQEDGSTVEKILELDWDPIIADDIIDKVMVTVRDVTELRAMQAKAEAQKEELDIVGEILHASPSKFDAFSDNAFKLLDKNRALIKLNKDKQKEVIADLFVNMHTVKGNARTYNLTHITDTVHEAESVYNDLRKNDQALWDQTALL